MSDISMSNSSPSSKSGKTQLEDMSQNELITKVKQQLTLMQKMKLKCDDLNSKQAIAKKEIDTYAEANEKLEIRLKEIEIVNAQLIVKLEERQKGDEKIQRLQQLNNGLQEQIDCLNSKQDTLIATLQSWEHDHKYVAEQLNCALKEKSDMEVLSGDLQIALEKAMSDISELQAKVIVMEHNSISQQPSNSQDIIEDLNQQLTELKEAQHFNSITCDNYADNSGILEDFFRVISELNPDIDFNEKGVKERLEDTGTLIRGLAYDNARLKQDLFESKCEFEKLIQTLGPNLSILEGEGSTGHPDKQLCDKCDSWELVLHERQAELVNSKLELDIKSQDYQVLQEKFSELLEEKLQMTMNYEEVKNTLELKISAFDHKTTSYKNIETEMKQLETENAGLISLKAEFEKQIGQLQMEIERKSEKLHQTQKDLDDERVRSKNAKSTIDKLKQEKARQNLMSLEMSDYEKAVERLKSDLETKKTEVQKLVTEIQSLSSKNSDILSQLDEADNKRILSDEKVEKTKSMLASLNEQLHGFRQIEAELLVDNKALKEENEALSQATENLKLEMARISSTQSVEQESYRSLQNQHQRAVNSLESKVRTLQNRLEGAEVEIKAGRDEYENYKVRVRSVLQKQKESSSKEEELIKTNEEFKQNNSRLQLIVDQLTNKVQQLGGDLKVAQTEKSCLESELDSTDKAQEQIKKSFRQNEEFLKQTIEDMRKEMQMLKLEHSGELATLKSTNQEIASTYSIEIGELKEAHGEVVRRLNRDIEMADNEIIKMQHELTSLRHGAEIGLRYPEHSTFNEAYSKMQSERRDGEGMDLTDLPSCSPIDFAFNNGDIPKPKEPLTLEQLLSQTEDTESEKSTTSCKTFTASRENELQLELTVVSKKMDHVSKLLNESESNCMRLSEQSKLLKDEIRRLERNHEREEHAKNLEYMKNVIIKFFTLQSGDEKERLVPVLSTMLRLSPEEHKQMAQVAKSNALSTGAAAEVLNTAWTNYAPKWPGFM